MRKILYVILKNTLFEKLNIEKLRILQFNERANQYPSEWINVTYPALKAIENLVDSPDLLNYKSKTLIRLIANPAIALIPGKYGIDSNIRFLIFLSAFLGEILTISCGVLITLLIFYLISLILSIDSEAAFQAIDLIKNFIIFSLIFIRVAKWMVSPISEANNAAKVWRIIFKTINFISSLPGKSYKKVRKIKLYPSKLNKIIYRFKEGLIRVLNYFSSYNYGKLIIDFLVYLKNDFPSEVCKELISIATMVKKAAPHLMLIFIVTSVIITGSILGIKYFDSYFSKTQNTNYQKVVDKKFYILNHFTIELLKDKDPHSISIIQQKLRDDLNELQDLNSIANKKNTRIDFEVADILYNRDIRLIPAKRDSLENIISNKEIQYISNIHKKATKAKAFNLINLSKPFIDIYKINLELIKHQEIGEKLLSLRRLGIDFDPRQNHDNENQKYNTVDQTQFKILLINKVIKKNKDNLHWSFFKIIILFTCCGFILYGFYIVLKKIEQKKAMEKINFVSDPDPLIEYVLNPKIPYNVRITALYKIDIPENINKETLLILEETACYLLTHRRETERIIGSYVVKLQNAIARRLRYREISHLYQAN